ncbi:MAG: hypothetical protein WCT03_01615 [Candidatus Obscuribacterales bacterium]|jgi:hypothetical protein
MTIPINFSDQDIILAATFGLQEYLDFASSCFESIGSNSDCITICPQNLPTSFASISLAPGELVTLVVSKDRIGCLVTTRRLIWLDKFGKIQSQSLKNIKTAALFGSLGDPAYPSGLPHYFLNGELMEGHPPNSDKVTFQQISPRYQSPFICVIDSAGSRHEIKLVPRAPLYAVLWILGMASSTGEGSRWEKYLSLALQRETGST